MIKAKLFIAAVGLAVALVSTAQATTLDIGTDGAGYLNGGYFSVSSAHPTGTGVFDPFMTLQRNGWEQGYNSSVGNFDTKREPQWNHEIRFSDLQVTNIAGVAYFGFSVDVNEPNGGSQAGISLDGLRLFTSATLQNSTSVGANGFFNGSLGTLRFDLGANVLLYNDQHSGSGQGDINIFIPVSAFAGTQANDYVYMYQRWGNTDGTGGGFEETSLIQGITPIPEVSSFLPIIGLIGAVAATSILRRRRGAAVVG